VWWVFGQLWEKGLLYRGFKVGLVFVSAACTPTS
jgi:isoleucyl-tRNA synthetase